MLEVGKKYLTKSGKIIKLISKSVDVYYAGLDQHTGAYYRIDESGYQGNDPEGPFTIVSEYKEPRRFWVEDCENRVGLVFKHKPDGRDDLVCVQEVFDER